MKDGFVRVAAASPALQIGNPKYNAEEILKLVDAAKAQSVRVLVFPELSVTAYTAYDLFTSTSLLSAAEAATARLIEATKDSGMLIFVGVPVSVHGKLYNCAAAIAEGKLLGLVPKTYLPDGAGTDECRYFTKAPKDNLPVKYAGFSVLLGCKQLFTCEGLPALSVAAEICEDLWVCTPPALSHAGAGATLIVNLSADAEVIGKAERRRMLIKALSARTISAYLYANAGEGESTGDAVFAGASLLCENGTLLAEKLPFASDSLLYGEIDVSRLATARQKRNTFPAPTGDYTEIGFTLPLTETPLSSLPKKYPFIPAASHLSERAELALSIQSRGLATRLSRARAKGAVIGLSGGLDSTLALLVTARATDALSLPRTAITAVTMPCFGTTERTRGNAEKLAEALGVTLRTVDIHAAVTQHFTDIGHDPQKRDATYENSQARERTQILMDVANAENALVIGTGDLSELALGWATYNGDHMSMYGVNAGIPKTLVRALTEYAASQADKAGDSALAQVLFDILATPVSPELLPPEDGKIAQCTEELVGPYSLHDFFLFHFISNGFAPKKILRLATLVFADEFSPDVIRRWLLVFLRRFFTQQFKRSCLPDGPKVGTLSLSPRGELRMASDASFELWLKELETE